MLTGLKWFSDWVGPCWWSLWTRQHEFRASHYKTIKAFHYGLVHDKSGSLSNCLLAEFSTLLLYALGFDLLLLCGLAHIGWAILVWARDGLKIVPKNLSGRRLIITVVMVSIWFDLNIKNFHKLVLILVMAIISGYVQAVTIIAVVVAMATREREILVFIDFYGRAMIVVMAIIFSTEGNNSNTG